ncbi:hypothetical protein ACFE04_025067 [Oxalis oulophora]
MIDGKAIYDVLSAIVPLYVAMILAYGSVRWWKIFSPDQCAGINRFVAVFAVPLLSFHFISSNNIYAMNYHFLAADCLQKLVILSALFIWQMVSKRGSLEWMITLFSLSTLPNTLVMGIPLLRAMYGDYSAGLMVQIVVLQSIIWYTLMLFLFEYRGAKLLIAEQFPETAGSITSFRVDSDVVSLNGREPLQADAEIGDDGKLHVVVRRSSAASSMISSFNKLNNNTSLTPRASNLTGVEIYSVQSSREPTPRASSFNQNDFYAMFNKGPSDIFASQQSSKGATPRTSNMEEEMLKIASKKKGGRSMSGDIMNNNGSYPQPNPMYAGGRKKELSGSGGGGGGTNMFMWSSSTSPVSEGKHAVVNKGASGSSDFASLDASNKAALTQHESAVSTVTQAMTELIENKSSGKQIGGDHDHHHAGNNNIGSPNSYITSNSSKKKKLMDLESNNIVVVGKKQQQVMPPASVMTRLILIMVWRKLIRNPNTYASLIGLTWSLVSFRWNIKMPSIISGSISILSDAGLGMAMFSLGLFMALQPKMIACGNKLATFAMVVRFLTGPAVIAATAITIGVRGVLLHVAIVQAALPQGIVPFVFAKEYNVHADILSTGVIFGMLIALPITILYYVLLGI